ncbi:MAG TPA: competence/damage-inducible protein A [Bryobacteraceae bacterium]|nr:competence/damage-inducible protein A [Bryobacteraceae bacterium]
MNATIVAVGSEMLTPQKTDTNSLYVTDQLNALGIEVVEKYVVGDDRLRLSNLIVYALGHSEFIFITGGLGPTEDDVTRDAVAIALGRSQNISQDICDVIEARFRRLGRRMSEVNRRQANIIGGAEILPNDRGTAPGQWLTGANGQIVVLLPGPPKEMKSMFEAQCLPRLTAMLPPMVIRTRFYRVAGMPESDLDQLIAPVYTRYTNPVTTILAAQADIQIHLRARCATADEAETLLAEVGSQIEPLLGDRLYTCVGEPLEACVGAMLAARGETLAVAESATGGFLGERITQVSGSSRYFLGGFLTYSSEAKTQLLGVPEGSHPVSEDTARRMAEAARERLGSTWAISVTGEAGPESATDMPVGTVFLGIAGPDGTRVTRHYFLGDRARVRIMSTQTALDLLRGRLTAIS